MSFLHNVLASFHLPLKIYNSIGKFLRVKKNSELRVLLYHDIALEDRSRFRSQLEKISETWQFVSPQVFEEMIRGEREIIGRNVLLTFDDGYLSNRVVAEEILGPMKIQALFFIISDFVDVQNDEQRKQFISKNIYPDFTPAQVPEHWIPMPWKDLHFLLKQGHSIGSHTRTHARLSKIDSSERLEDEILSSKKKLERELGIQLKHFAYTFGDLGSFSKQALTIAKENYEFVHTGLRGDNGTSPSWAIRREAFSTSDSDSLMGAIMEGGADLLYKSKLRIYESWGSF